MQMMTAGPTVMKQSSSPAKARELPAAGWLAKSILMPVSSPTRARGNESEPLFEREEWDAGAQPVDIVAMAIENAARLRFHLIKPATCRGDSMPCGSIGPRGKTRTAWGKS